MSEFRFNPNSTVIIMPVDIKGKNDFIETLRLVIDTGATYTLIPWRIASSLGIELTTPQESLNLTTASGVEKVSLISLESVKLGDKEIKNCKTVLHDLPSKSYADGLLGLSFLKNFKLAIDFQTGVLSLE